MLRQLAMEPRQVLESGFQLPVPRNGGARLKLNRFAYALRNTGHGHSPRISRKPFYPYRQAIARHQKRGDRQMQIGPAHRRAAGRNEWLWAAIASPVRVDALKAPRLGFPM